MEARNLKDQPWREHLELILETMPEAVIVVSKDGRITFANKAAEGILGLKRADIVGRVFKDPIWKATTVDGKPLPEDKRAFSQAMRTGKPVYGVEFGLERPDGTRVVISANAMPFRSKANEIIGVIVSFSDITEKKRSEEEREQLAKRIKLLLDSTDEAIYELDLKGKALLFNRAAAEMTGYRVEEVVGKNIHKLIHHTRKDGSPYPVDECPVISAARTGRGVRVDTEVFWRKDGTAFPVEYSSYPIVEEGIIRGAVVTFTDITGRKKVEETLRRSKELSDALNDINAAITSTLDFDEIMRRVVVASAKAIGSETAVVDLREGSYWVIRYAYGMPQELIGMRFSDEEAKHATLAARLREPVIVNDAYSDERLHQRLVREYKIRSFITVPLAVKEEVIGALSFHYHSAAIPFDEAQVDFAEKLAASISLALENVRLYAAERNIADILQGALLTVPEKIEGIEYGSLYCSATETARVGGDFYDLFELEHNRVGLVVGDVSGKGLEAAALTSLVKNTIKAYAYENGSPSSILQRVNEIVIRESAPSMFITLFFGVLNTRTGHLIYCSAGHPPAILKKKTMEISFLITSSPVIGAFAGLNFIDDETKLKKGDVLVLYTDGITEARCNRDFFGEERLVSFIRDLKHTSAKQTPQVLFNEVMGCTKGRLTDDIAILTVSLNGK